MEPSPSPHIRGDIRILNRKGSFLTEDLVPQKGRRSLGVPGGTLRGRSTFHGEFPRRRAAGGGRGRCVASWPSTRSPRIHCPRLCGGADEPAPQSSELLASLGQSAAAARGVGGLRCLGLRFRPAALNFIAKDKSFKKCLLLRMDFQIHK